jgi:hypothetical protein
MVSPLRQIYTFQNITAANDWPHWPLVVHLGRGKNNPPVCMHKRWQSVSEDAYNAAADPKELIIIPNTSHVDLYDRLDIIPFDKLSSFFNRYLKSDKAASIAQADSSAQ